MLCLTSQERKALIFLCGLVLLGFALRLSFREKLSGLAVPVRSAEKGREFTVNINTAGINELVRIPGIGTVTAQRIISYRQLNGRFNKAEDLIEVKGIGPSKLQSIKKYISSK